MRKQDRGTASCLLRAVLVVIGVIVALVIGVVGLVAYSLSDAGRTLPHAGEEMDALNAESITRFVPSGATVTASRSSAAKRPVLFETAESSSTLFRHLATTDIAGTMTAFIDPAVADGWTLVSVDCQRVANSSELLLVKQVPLGAGKYRTMELHLSYDQFSGGVDATASVPRGGLSFHGEAKPIDQLLYTGISRTDPGCVRDHRTPPTTAAFTSPSSIPPPWDSATTCAVVQSGWPTATVEPSSSEYCVVVVDGRSLNVKAASVDPYDYEDKRLSPAGGATMFATTEGGFWVARPDGVALVAPGSGYDPLPETELLRLAQLLADAPSPATTG